MRFVLSTLTQPLPYYALSRNTRYSHNHTLYQNYPAPTRTHRRSYRRVARCRTELSTFFESGGGNNITEVPPANDLTHFDPIAALKDVQAYAGEGAQLVELSTTYVAWDGTMNLTAEGYYPSADYIFVRQVSAPDNELPIGAGGSASGQYYQKIEVNIDNPGKWYTVTSGEESYTYLHKGMEKDEDTPTGTSLPTIALPTCSFAALWQYAIVDGMPTNAVAFIDYNTQGYTFTIRDLNYDVRFNRECEVIRE